MKNLQSLHAILWLIAILSRIEQGHSEVDDKCNLALELLEVIPVIQFAYGHDQTIRPFYT